MITSQDIVKYRFALLDHQSGTVVGIDDLSRETTSPHKFFCPYCHEEMYPTFGPKQIPHFRHKGDKCNPDKYLHSLAEKIFEAEYLNCIEFNKPFILEIHSPVECFKECSHNQNGICYKFQDTLTVDLTKTFGKIEKEIPVKFDGHFRIPDILLSSVHNSEDINLWVEIWVKHETDEKKKAEGSILEIKISSEEDLNPIREHKIIVSENGKHARIFNPPVFPERCILVKNEHDMLMCHDQTRNIPIRKQLYVKKKSAFKSQTATPIEFSKKEWVDLGLPSGILWAEKDEDVSVPFHMSMQSYPNNLPSEPDAEELRKYCSKEVDSVKKEIIFTGPNGNSISFKYSEKPISYWLNKYEENDTNYGKCFHLIPNGNVSFYINNKDSSKLLSIHLVCRCLE